MKLALTFSLLLLLSGCSTTGKDGARHYLVLGFGVVSVDNVNSSRPAVYKMKTLGLGISDMPGIKLGAGYSSSTVIVVPPSNNICLEIIDTPFKPLKLR